MSSGSWSKWFIASLNPLVKYPRKVETCLKNLKFFNNYLKNINFTLKRGIMESAW